jgi:hypothetical protein
MLASLLRRSQLPGENENRNWPVCKAPVSLKLGGADPRHFLRCTTCTISVRRRALMVMNHSLACCFFSDAQKPRRRQFCLLLSLSYDGPEWKERDSTLDGRGLVLKKTSTKMEPKQKETSKIWCNRGLIQIGSLSAAGLSSTKLQKRATATL